MRLISLASAAFLALVFVYAGIDKALHYDGFVNALGSYSLLPTSIAPGLAPGLIFLEVLVGLALLVPRWRSRAALTGAAALGAFTVALVVNHFVAPGSVCGCWFSITLAESDGGHILLNLVLMGLALTLWARDDERLAGRIEEPSLSLAR